MSKKANMYDIQERAFNSLKFEFAKAAKKGEKAIAKKIVEFAKSDKRAERYSTTSEFDMISEVNNLRFLEYGANGKYMRDNFFLNMRNGLDLWDDYLKDINRRHYGFGCIYANEAEVEKRIKQNGPKKMEKRLKQYLKRRIKKSLARI